MKLKEEMNIDGALLTKRYKETPELLNNSKGKRETNVGNIIVEIELNSVQVKFQGDEMSQSRLHRAFTIMSELDIETTKWKGADNTIYDISKGNIIELLHKSAEAQTMLWFSV